MQLVPLKVEIGLKTNGHAKYPNFNLLQVVKDSGLDWCVYVDTYGTGWMYDNTSGHKDGNGHSSLGKQWGMLLVPQTFADQAILSFSSECTKLTDTEAGIFYESYVTVYNDSEIISSNILTDIKAKQDLGKELTPEQIKALDPNDPTPGICNNPLKTWIGMKNKKSITI
jgi:hypothetical protein